MNRSTNAFVFLRLVELFIAERLRLQPQSSLIIRSATSAKRRSVLRWTPGFGAARPLPFSLSIVRNEPAFPSSSIRTFERRLVRPKARSNLWHRTDPGYGTGRVLRDRRHDPNSGTGRGLPTRAQSPAE